MTVRIPLAVRLKTARGDRVITSELRDLSFRSTSPGGYASAEFSLNRPLTLQPDDIDVFGQVYITDRRHGGTIWEGRLEDPGRQAGRDGAVYSVSALGPVAHMQDVSSPLVYVDRQVASWSQGGPSAHCSAVQVSNTEDDTLTMAVAVGNTHNAGQAGLVVYEPIQNNGLELGSVVIDWNSGTTSSNYLARFSSSLGAGASVTVDEDSMSISADVLTGSRGGVNAITAGHDTARLRWVRITSAIGGADGLWIAFSPMVQMLRKHADGTDATSGYGTIKYVQAKSVVNDLLGRLLPKYDGANAIVESTLHQIDQMSYPDGATALKVLEDILEMEAAYTFHVWEDTGAGNRFEFISIPTTVRYEADVNDGYDSPGSGGDLYNQVTVRWKDSRGYVHTTLRTQTVQVLDDAGLTRRAHVDLGDEIGSSANAIQVGDNFLIEHKAVPNAGRLTVARPIHDRQTGRWVMPWEIVPGELIRVRGVQPNPFSLYNSERDGVTVMLIKSMEFGASSGTATLELDVFTRTQARAIAELVRERKKRRR